MKKVSIIVPVYNAEKTLWRCVDSILRQNGSDFELLLVDDGSTDRSGKICDEYAEKDGRVQAFHTPNRGVSAARNLALSKAEGEYIQFADSDDWLPADALAAFLKAAETADCDLVISDYYMVAGKRRIRRGDIREKGIFTRAEFAKFMIEKPGHFYYGALWNKFYRRRIVENNHLCMDESANWSEDLKFNLEYFRCADTFCALQKPLYCYVRNSASGGMHGLSTSEMVKMRRGLFKLYQEFCKSAFTREEYIHLQKKIQRFRFALPGDAIVPPWSRRI